jgi:hypothetical protein
MKIHFLVLTFLLFMLIFTACGGRNSQEEAESAELKTAITLKQNEGETDTSLYLKSLDEFAELERAGTWLQGMAVTESGIRENAGDYAGAVAAAYKEMALAYGRGMVEKKDIEQGLINLLKIDSGKDVTASANAVLAFFRENWTEASAGLALLFDEYEEPDSFVNWMLLVCALEKNREDRRSGAAYKAIRARYTQFPEYWYRGAKAFSGSVAAEYAENCINSSSQGPFADECRGILAVHTGLKTEDGLLLKTKREIELIISQSVNTANPVLLDSLLPLISLPDNPYTVYATGALRVLTQVPVFRDYFNAQVSASSGRLAERLSYICRG